MAVLAGIVAHAFLGDFDSRVDATGMDAVEHLTGTAEIRFASEWL